MSSLPILQFRIVPFSDLAYEGMTVDVEYGGERIAQLNMDRGAGAIEIHLLGSPYDSPAFVPKFPFMEFLEAMQLARSRLLEYPDPTVDNLRGRSDPWPRSE